MLRPARIVVILALASALPGCGATLRDPLAIGPMLKRCQEQAERGEQSNIFPAPILPILGCR